MRNGLIGYMFQNRPRNWLENIWWKIKGYFGWKNTSGIQIVASDEVKSDTTMFLCRR